MAQRSHARIARRTADRDHPVSPAVFNRILQTVGPDIRADWQRVREALMTTSLPILIISGDHDISFPVENWYALSVSCRPRSTSCSVRRTRSAASASRGRSGLHHHVHQDGAMKRAAMKEEDA